MSDESQYTPLPGGIDFHTDLSVGEILRRARIHYGQDLFQVEQALRIRASQLEALENGDIDKLPGRVYAVGFVRAYAEYLGLDGERVVQLFKTQSIGAQSNKPELAFPVTPNESKMPARMLIGLSLAGLVVLIALMNIMNTGGSSEPVPSVPANLAQDMPEIKALIPPENQFEAPQEQAQAQTQEPPVTEPLNTDQPVIVENTGVQESQNDPLLEQPQTDPVMADPQFVENFGDDVILKAIEPVWIEIRNPAGSVVFSEIMRSGDRYVVSGEKEYIMHTGNAGGLQITAAGQAIPFLGERGDVRRNVLLTPDFLKKLASRL